MEIRQVGSLSVSALGLGVGNITDASRDAVRGIVAAALDQGISYFDISNRPASTEQHLGQMLRGHRDSVVIGTKFGSRPRPGVLADASPDCVRSCVEASLRNLDTDRLDLLYLHRPDPATPIADTLGALGELVQAGKIREIACSKFSSAQLVEADEVACGARFVAVENHCSLLDASDVADVLPLCADRGIGYMAYWPLAAGLLSGKYRRGEAPPVGTRFVENAKWIPRRDEWHTDANYDVLERLVPWAEEQGHTILELSFAWLLGHPQVATMIAGASSPDQLAANAAAAAAWTLTPEEHAEVTTIALDRPDAA